MTEDSESPTPLILDLGSVTTRMGRAGEDLPETIITTEIARAGDFRFKKKVIPALDNLLEDFIEDPLYFGDAIHRVRDLLNVERFMVTNNWTALERFLDHHFNLLAVDPQQTPMIFILPAKEGATFIDRIQRLMFDRFNIPKIMFLPSTVCILQALNSDSGVVVSLGNRHSVIQSIFKGFENELGPLEMDVTGERITDYFGLMISKLQVNVHASIGEIQEIKEKVALFVRDVEEALNTIDGGTTKYQYDFALPNGDSILFDKERFLCVEPYFQPDRINSSALPLSILIGDAIKQWGLTERPILALKIILTGGGSIIPNIVERLDFEMRKIFPNMEVKIIAPAGRENLEWVGASLLFAKGGLEEKWVPNMNWEKRLQKAKEAKRSKEEGES